MPSTQKDVPQKQQHTTYLLDWYTHICKHTHAYPLYNLGISLSNGSFKNLFLCKQCTVIFLFKSLWGLGLGFYCTIIELWIYIVKSSSGWRSDLSSHWLFRTLCISFSRGGKGKILNISKVTFPSKYVYVWFTFLA